MKICMVTGGSGGHIYPALTFADYVKNNSDIDVFFIGNDHKMESEIVPNHGYDFYAIHNQGLQGSFVDKIKAVLGQVGAILQARKHLKKLKPDLVFTFGGYVSLPVVLAAKSLGIKVVLHEQNAFVGKANRMSAKYAAALFTAWDEAFKDEPHVYNYGNPRASLGYNPEFNPKEHNRIGLHDQLPIVLCVMGSQGSQTMNQIFMNMIPKLNNIDYQILFVTGKLEYDNFVKNMPSLPENVFVEGFIDQGALMPYVDLLVARAGASTLTEIIAFDKPSILIPSPYVADNHQYFNAKALSDQGAAILIEEKMVTDDSLILTIDTIIKDREKLNELKSNLGGFKTPNVNSDILNKILEILR